MGYDWQIIVPEIAILATAFILLIADLFLKRGRNAILTGISFVGVMAAMILTFGNFQSLAFGFANTVISDSISFYFRIIFCLGTLLTIFVSSTYIKREMKSIAEYYVLVFISTFGMMVMAASADLITIFLGLEVMSIPLYVLAGIERERNRSREASLKYFLMGAFASGFLLYGIALLFGAYGTTNLLEIAKRLNFGANYSQVLSSAGLASILIGLGFKAALAPFHMWVPDVYEGSIAPVTAFMSAGPKAAAFAALFRILSLFSPVMSDKFTTVLWVLAVITMTWGNILAISQKNIKRMLAYSSVEHMGILSLGADFSRVNQRMHNKMFVADNQAGIAGGRNIGDEYFSAKADVNFADMDLLAEVDGGFRVRRDEYPWGSAHYLAHGAMMPADALTILVRGVLDLDDAIFQNCGIKGQLDAVWLVLDGNWAPADR